jgi:hypothetical protein
MAPPAVSGKPAGPTGAERAPVGGNAPMTEAECTGLSGKVHPDIVPGVCNSGKVCELHDQNGNQYLVCINPKQ